MIEKGSFNQIPEIPNLESDDKKRYIVKLKKAGVVGSLSVYGEVVLKKHFPIYCHLTAEKDVLDDIKKLQEVETAFESKPMHTEVMQPMNYPFYPQWGLSAISNDYVDGSTTNKYRYNLTGKGVDIYIMDTGINYAHTEFLAGPDYDLGPEGSIRGYRIYNGRPDQIEEPYSPHGIHVASLAGGTICGPAKNARILDCMAYLFHGDMSYLDGAEAIIDHHLENPDRPAILNTSLGDWVHTQERRDFWDYIILTLAQNGVMHVTASGNSALHITPQDLFYTAPGPEEEVICVGASARYGNVVGFSNYGSGIDIFAPGTDVWGAAYSGTWANEEPHSTWQPMSGTSMASPYVAGVLALALEADGLPVFEGTAEEIRQQVIDYQNQFVLKYQRYWNPDFPIDDATGPQMVMNNEFRDSVGWDLGLNWTIASGSLRKWSFGDSSATQTNQNMRIPFEIGKEYFFEYKAVYSAMPSSENARIEINVGGYHFIVPTASVGADVIEQKTFVCTEESGITFTAIEEGVTPRIRFDYFSVAEVDETGASPRRMLFSLPDGYVGKDPLSILYDGIWDILESDVEFADLVAPGNRIKFSGDNQNPMKEEGITADYPEVRVVPISSTPHISRTSNGSSIVKRLAIQILTGDQRVDDKLFPLEWCIFRVMGSKYLDLMQLKYKEKDFVKIVKPISVTDNFIPSDSLNPGIRGWTSVWMCDVEMWFETNEL